MGWRRRRRPRRRLRRLPRLRRTGSLLRGGGAGVGARPTEKYASSLSQSAQSLASRAQGALPLPVGEGKTASLRELRALYLSRWERGNLRRFASSGRSTSPVGEEKTAGVFARLADFLSGASSGSFHRRVVRRIREDGLHLAREGALRFGGCFHLLPFGIALKRLPVLRRSLAARMRQDIDERALLQRRVLRLEVAN